MSDLPPPAWFDCEGKVNELYHNMSWVRDWVRYVDWPFNMDGREHAVVEIIRHALYWPPRRRVRAPFQYATKHVHAARVLGLRYFQINYFYRAVYVFTRQYVIGLPVVVDVCVDHMQQVRHWSPGLERRLLDILMCPASEYGAFQAWCMRWLYYRERTDWRYRIRTKAVIKCMDTNRMDRLIPAFSTRVSSMLDELGSGAPHCLSKVYVHVREVSSKILVRVQTDSVSPDAGDIPEYNSM